MLLPCYLKMVTEMITNLKTDVCQTPGYLFLDIDLLV